MENKDTKVYAIIWVDIDMNNKESVMSGVSGVFLDKEVAKDWLKEQYEIEKNNTDIEFNITLTDDELFIEYEIDNISYLQYKIVETTLREKNIKSTF